MGLVPGGVAMHTNTTLSKAHGGAASGSPRRGAAAGRGYPGSMTGRRPALALLVAAVAIVALACSGGGGDDPAPGAASSTPDAAPTAGAPLLGSATTTATTTEEPAPSPTLAPATATPATLPEDDPAGAPISYEELIRASYVAALLVRDGADIEAAIEGFGRVRDADGPLAPIAALRLAQALAQAGRDAEAKDAFAAALADPELPASLAHVAHLERGDVLAALDRVDDALASYAAAAAAVSAGPTDVAAARSRSAALLREQGDPLWIDEALGAIRVAPGSPGALTALDALDEAAVAVAPLEAAYVRYRSWDTATATELYEEVAAAPLTAADAATAWFYLGALAERYLDNPAALDAYTRSLEFDSSGYLADDAYWWLALLLEDAGRPLDAVAHYDALTVGFPSSLFAADAALRSALALAQANRDAAAAARLRQLMASAAPSQAATAARWLEVLGLRTEADLLPSDYDPSSLAAVLETAGDATLTEPLLAEWSAPEADWEEAFEWMSARFGPRPAGSAPSVLNSPAYALAVELTMVREGPAARALLFELIAAHAAEPYALLDLARASSEAGLHDIALVAALRLLAPLGPAERAEASLALELLAYPAPFTEELLAATEAEGVPPLLLLALVRQESAFNPDAGSPAGALGLTQVIPPTGAQIAASLEIEWDADLLYEPASSLCFGAHYLATQLANFEGDLLAARAAYNAGPTQAARWYERQSLPGPNGYIDAVDFIETRRYLTRVIENYAWYRHLYLGIEQPSIR